MVTKSNVNRSQQQDADQKLVDGINKHSQTMPSLVFGGTSNPPTAIIAVLQARIATANAALSTRATWQAAVKADLDERTKTKAYVSGLRQALQLAFAGSIDGLADFGLKPRKQRTARTPEQKAAAVAKAQATRAARHTMGKKQKAKVKGAAPQAPPATPPSPTTAPSAPKPAEPIATAPAQVTTPHQS